MPFFKQQHISLPFNPSCFTVIFCVSYKNAHSHWHENFLHLTIQFNTILNLGLIWNVCPSQPTMCISQILSFCNYQEGNTNNGLPTLFVATWNDYAGICKPLKEIYIVKYMFILVLLYHSTCTKSEKWIYGYKKQKCHLQIPASWNKVYLDRKRWVFYNWDMAQNYHCTKFIIHYAFIFNN